MDWNIEGIACRILSDMREDEANINELEYYLQDAFKSVYSREPDQAELVIAQVREHIENEPDF